MSFDVVMAMGMDALDRVVDRHDAFDLPHGHHRRCEPTGTKHEVIGAKENIRRRRLLEESVEARPPAAAAVGPEDRVTCRTGLSGSGYELGRAHHVHFVWLGSALMNVRDKPRNPLRPHRRNEDGDEGNRAPSSSPTVTLALMLSATSDVVAW
jgi:hypothetical protein